jgi:hypothetical protein
MHFESKFFTLLLVLPNLFLRKVIMEFKNHSKRFWIFFVIIIFASNTRDINFSSES